VFFFFFFSKGQKHGSIENSNLKKYSNIHNRFKNQIEYCERAMVFHWTSNVT